MWLSKARNCEAHTQVTKWLSELDSDVIQMVPQSDSEFNITIIGQRLVKNVDNMQNHMSNFSIESIRRY